MSNGTRFKDILPPEYLQQAQELEKERKRYLKAHDKAWARYAAFQQKISQALLAQVSSTQASLAQASLEQALLDNANKEAERQRIAEEVERNRLELERIELKNQAEEKIKDLAQKLERKEFVQETIAIIKDSKQFMKQEAERKRLAEEARQKRLAEKKPYIPKFIVKKEKK